MTITQSEILGGDLDATAIDSKHPGHLDLGIDLRHVQKNISMRRAERKRTGITLRRN